MMSRRAVAMRRESARVLSEGRSESLESGAVRAEGVNTVFGASVAVGRRNEFNTDVTDFVRW